VADWEFANQDRYIRNQKKTGALVLLVWLLINLTFDIFLRLIQVNTLVFPGGVPSP